LVAPARPNSALTIATPGLALRAVAGQAGNHRLQHVQMRDDGRILGWVEWRSGLLRKVIAHRPLLYTAPAGSAGEPVAESPRD